MKSILLGECFKLRKGKNIMVLLFMSLGASILVRINALVSIKDKYYLATLANENLSYQVFLGEESRKVTTNQFFVVSLLLILIIHENDRINGFYKNIELFIFNKIAFFFGKAVVACFLSVLIMSMILVLNACVNQFYTSNLYLDNRMIDGGIMINAWLFTLIMSNLYVLLNHRVTFYLLMVLLLYILPLSISPFYYFKLIYVENNYDLISIGIYFFWLLTTITLIIKKHI